MTAFRLLLGIGRVDRRTYLGWGLALALIKYNGDRLLIDNHQWVLFKPETLYAYLFTWWPAGTSPEQLRTGAAVLLWSLPFIWVGTMLTLARLRDARMNPWWVLLFFVPAVKFVFFVLLSLVPGGGPVPETPAVSPRWTTVRRWLPRSRGGCALAAAAYASLICVGLVALATTALGSYGWALFVATPFIQGMVAALLFAVHHPLHTSDATGLATLSTALTGVLLFGLAMEGIICIAMAAPVAMVLAILGAWVARAIVAGTRNVPEDRLMCATLLAVPLLVSGESLWAPEPPRFTVASEVVIQAPPERIWPLIVQVDPLPATQDVWSRTGIATFQRAWTDGEGTNGVRYCEFNLGLAREPIEVWEPPRRLRLRVETTPPPMEEWSIFPHLHPRHLDGFYQVTAAEFQLEPVPGGTRVRGMTEYQHGLWPTEYWTRWCNPVLRALQRRVLAAVKTRAEGP